MTVALDAALEVHPHVALRPEPFGALAYHYDTRRLVFLRSPDVLAVVQALGEYADARSACRAAGVADDQQGPYLRALGTLAASNMLVPR